MMNFSLNRGSGAGVEQPDMFEKDAPVEENQRLKYQPGVSLGGPAEDKYVCPECENTSQACAHCHGRNWGYKVEDDN